MTLFANVVVNYEEEQYGTIQHYLLITIDYFSDWLTGDIFKNLCGANSL